MNQNGTATGKQIPAPNELEVLSAYPINLQGMNPKFTINIQSDGKMSLTIRTNDEEELEQLIEKWESRIVVFQEPVAPSGQQNGNGNRVEKTRYYPGDQCPQCSNKLVRRNGSKGKFLGCNNYPDCTFVQGL